MTTKEGKLDKTLFKGNTDAVVQHLDVTMMSSVRSFVAWFKEHEKKLDILINNKEMISK